MQSFLQPAGQLLTAVTNCSPSCVSLPDSERQHESGDSVTGEKSEAVASPADAAPGRAEAAPSRSVILAWMIVEEFVTISFNCWCF